MHRPARDLVYTLVAVLILAVVSAGSSQAQPTDLFFSEYVEGSSNNKAIEIYNGTASAVDLTAGGYTLMFYFNGGTTASFTLALSGTVPAGGTWVVAPTNANATILGVANQTSGTAWFNGDDAVVLRKTGSTGPLVDVIGQIGFDPGSEWGTGIQSTADNTIRRKATVCAGDTDGSNAFDPSIEWDGFATDTFSGLGAHSVSCVVADTAPSVSSTTPANAATGVAPNADLSVTFSEAVNVAGSWYTISCGTSGAHSATVTGGPTTFTINPDTDFTAGESCTATIVAAQVSDQDSNDPPDAMAANYVWSFQIASAVPALSINDVTVAEGNSGTTNFSFTVSLSVPAGPGGVTFDIATADGTATVAGNDYVAQSLTGQTIPAGSSTYTFTVAVNGDGTVEPNETFFVNVTNITGATAADAQGLGTINNDDVAITPIHDIQGPGTSSPIVGASVTTRGIVTAVKFNNGFFIQEPDASVDADPATSEGIFVFTSSAPPAAAAVGNLVQVTGTVTEYNQTGQYGFLTELTAPTVTLVSSGNPLPTSVTITSMMTSPGGSWEQLENLEGMRVTVTGFEVTAATDGNPSSNYTNGTSFGDCYGVVPGVARPFREDGIAFPKLPPAGTAIPPLFRFDSNPETIRVDTDGQVGATRQNFSARTVLPGFGGVLDYAFSRYSILPDAGSLPAGPAEFLPTPVTAPTATEFTVASYNLQRFYDDANDLAISDSTENTMSTAQLNARLAKASIGIRNYMRAPDVVGLVEVENLTVLQSLASRISSDAVAASQPDPQYVAYLVEGNDVGGIDVGFLVKTAPVYGSTPRVTVNAVVQELDGTLFVNPDSSTETLNDRPPLRLDAVVNHPNGASFPVTVIVNHLRSMNGVDDEAAGSNGWATVGARVRAKRQAQAVDLASLVQARQTAAPGERIVLVGDFNAFDVNDSLGHLVATIAGTPAPDATTAVPGDGVDLVTPDLVNLGPLGPAAERYSYVFDFTAQMLDHALANAPLVSGTLSRRLEYARINADFPEIDRSTTDIRLSDHDPLVAYFQVAAFQTADLAVTKTDSPDPVAAGTNLAWTIGVTNNGPDAAASASFSDTLPAGTTFVSLSAPGGWSCTTPAVGATGTVTCTNASLAAAGSASFTLTVAVGSGVANGTVISNTATVSSTTADGNAGNNSATATTVVNAQADLSVTLADSPDPVTAGNNLTWTSGVTNNGPSVSTSVGWALPLPAGTTFVSLSAPGWTCTTPAVGANGTVSCTIASLAVAGSGSFTVVAATNPALAGGSTITATAGVSSATTDPNAANDSAAATTNFNASSGVAIALSAAPEPVQPGAALAWTVTLTNSGPSTATNVTWSDALPAGTTFTSLNAAAGWSCTTPAAGTNGTVSCSLASFPVGTAVFTINGAVTAATLPGTAITNTAAITAVTGDSDPGDNSSSFVSHVVSPAVLSATKTVAGTGAPGATLTYTIVLSNTGTGAQFDNAGNELVDVLPASLTLVSANATSGTAVATVATNTVTWNGSIPAGGSVTITVSATISAAATTGQVITNQATASYDADGNGTNEATASSDDPGTAAVGDGTSITITRDASGQAVVPTLGGIGLAALALLVALGGALVLGRRLA